ncbi:phage tail tip lysozyme [Streptococcus sp. S784/96/1]|uniref:phage tail tip lysozyme n=1 Tax=Streptococcus sp. S784/96/1 TaxID=2653499 RepID=UPI001386F13A|nr:phage tail tip lysozyme [Streptococcus sp. S784/96/1]
MKRFRRGIVLLLVPILPLFFIFMILLSALGGSSSDSSSSEAIGGRQLILTAEEIAEKAGISVERAEDVIKIVNWQLSKEQFTVAGVSGSLANGERESGFDPKAVNPSGGVAGYFQWSGWDNKVNGDRWALAPRRALESDVELELMSKELNGSWSHVKEEMQKATDPKKAARIWSEKYEGVSLSDGQTKLTELEKDAQKWFDILQSGVEATGNSAVGDGQTLGDFWDFPKGYEKKFKYGLPTQKSITTQAGSGYPRYQCTWYVYNRLFEVGLANVSDGYGYLGNGQDWVNSLTARGWKRVAKPEVGAVMSEDFSNPWGHVSFVEHVNEDGSFVVSECNWDASGSSDRIHFRVLTPAPNRTFAVRK